jgi:hypothetical protein
VPPRRASPRAEIANPSDPLPERDECAIDESPAGAGAIFVDFDQHARLVRAGFEMRSSGRPVMAGGFLSLFLDIMMQMADILMHENHGHDLR